MGFLHFVNFLFVYILSDNFMEDQVRTFFIWIYLFGKITFFFLNEIGTKNGEEEKLFSDHASL